MIALNALKEKYKANSKEGEKRKNMKNELKTNG
jgi:hypothetical protein